MIEAGVSGLRKAVVFMYQWLTDEQEALGYILGFLHLMTGFVLSLLVVLSHIFPNIWFQLGVFLCVFAVWIQHILLNVCISIVAEESMTDAIAPFHKMMEEIVGVSVHECNMYTTYAEPAIVACLFLELLARIF